MDPHLLVDECEPAAQPRADVTLGEISNALREIYGECRDSPTD